MLTQLEADTLIDMKKTFVKRGTISIPHGTDQTHDLIGDDNRERFLLDLWRGTLRLSKLKFQTRGHIVIVLARLDIDGAPHTNPDGQILNGSHLHVYREGYEDKWAFPLSHDDFRNTSNIRQIFEDLCRYCNIETLPFQDSLV
jgi:hypothetical protein